MTQLFELTNLFGNLFQPWHIIILLVIVVLFFGGQKIPELMKGVGKGVGEFKKGLDEGNSDKEEDEPPAKPA